MKIVVLSKVIIVKKKRIRLLCYDVDNDVNKCDISEGGKKEEEEEKKRGEK